MPVKIIEPTININSKLPLCNTQKKRVCAYARVSTDDPEQLTSFENQKAHYDKLISSHFDWEHKGLFADEGISGTMVKNRKKFNEMIEKCNNGEIDMILVKSISRFARNIVDCLTNVRKLKSIGVDVFFEEENIHTLEEKGEILISVLATVAQEESRNISEHVKWAYKHNFELGKVYIPYGSFLGYAKGEDGKPIIVPKEAETSEYILF